VLAGLLKRSLAAYQKPFCLHHKLRTEETKECKRLTSRSLQCIALVLLQVYSVDLEDLDDFDTGDISSSSGGLAFTLKPIRDTAATATATAASTELSGMAHTTRAPTVQVQSYTRPLILDKLTDLLTAETSTSVAQAALIRPPAPAVATRTLCSVTQARLDHMQTVRHVFTVPAAVPYVAHSKDATAATAATTAAAAVASVEHSFDLFVDLTVVIQFRGRRQRGSYVRGRLSAVLLLVDDTTDTNVVTVDNCQAVGSDTSTASAKRRRIGYAPHALQAVCSDDALDKHYGKVRHCAHY
jgi:hypothetical protein